MQEVPRNASKASFSPLEQTGEDAGSLCIGIEKDAHVGCCLILQTTAPLIRWKPACTLSNIVEKIGGKHSGPHSRLHHEGSVRNIKGILGLAKPDPKGASLCAKDLTLVCV